MPQISESKESRAPLLLGLRIYNKIALKGERKNTRNQRRINSSSKQKKEEFWKNLDRMEVKEDMYQVSLTSPIRNTTTSEIGTKE